ncbi:MAG: Na+/H+ antiporter NhaA, partial [Ignavibacteriales bacterium]
NSGSEGSSGWGIPMATDIAFVVGILALLGSRVPIGLKIFVIALAIADDIGAVLVIAVFYTSDISFASLFIAGGFILVLIVANYIGIKNLLVYIFLGLGLWLAFLFSGVHATVAGVLLAFTIPATSRINSKEFMIEGTKLLQDFDDAGEEVESTFTNEERLTVARALERNSQKVMTPLSRFETSLHPWVSFFIIPLFALANAGVSFGEDFFPSLTDPISIGIITGLFLGKQTGIFLFAWLAIKLNIAAKPAGVNWTKIYAAGILAGIGFTMSLFIANLAFQEPALLDISKVGILTASVISGITGFTILKKSLKNNV